MAFFFSGTWHNNSFDDFSPEKSFISAWKTNVIQLKDGKISEIIIDPYLLNVNADKFENLIGGDANFNAAKMIDIFKLHKT